MSGASVMLAWSCAMARMAAQATVEDGDLDLRSLGHALWQRRSWILWPTLLVAMVSAIAVNMITPRYKSEARILYDGRENVFLRPEAEKTANGERPAADPETLTSQVQVVLSRQLALEVIGELKLNDLPEFDPVLRPTSILHHILSLLGVSRDYMAMTPEERVLESWYDRLTAYPVDKSRVIVIEFQSWDPVLAARITNAIADSYLRMEQSVRQEQTRGAGQWLAGEIERLRRKVADAEAKAEEFRSHTNLLVGTNNTTLSNQQLGELNSQVVTARGQRADSETRAKIIRDMLRKGESIEASDIVNSELVRRLSEQRGTLRAQLAEQSTQLLDGHPRIKELKAQIGDLDKQIRAEAEKLVRTLENEARIAGARVDASSANLDMVKRQAASTNEQDVQLRALDREAKAQRDLLESYLAKYRETTARETIGSAPPDAKIISAAIASNTPYFPKKLPIVAVATLITLLLSAGLVTTGELLRVSAGAPVPAGGEEPEPTLDLAARARAALAHRGDGDSAASDGVAAPLSGVPLGSVEETAQRLRSNAGLGRGVAVFAVPSGAPKTASNTASKTATVAALALARTLAGGAKVVLVGLVPDASEAMGLEANATGLAEVVRGAASFGQVIRRDNQSRLHLVAFGLPDCAIDTILNSRRFLTMIEALAKAYDHVVIDAGDLGGATLRLTAIAPRGVLVASEDTQREAASGCRMLAGAGFADVAVMAWSAAATGQAHDLAAA
jgi:succinoglycan biosynthesis transport protein ExoP